MTPRPPVRRTPGHLRGAAGPTIFRGPLLAAAQRPRPAAPKIKGRAPARGSQKTLAEAGESARRDRVVDEAIASHRIRESERARWRAHLDRDPGAEAVLARLQPVPLP